MNAFPGPAEQRGLQHATRVASVAAASSNSSSGDNDAKRQAVLAVVSLWLNRLALVSGITTFFASIDSLLFSLASSAMHVGDPNLSDWSAVDKLAVTCFCGALILHICSAIIAFLGSFVLIRLQLVDADDQEHQSCVSEKNSEPLFLAEGTGHLHQNSASIDSTAHPTINAPVAAANHNPQWKCAYNSVYSRVAVRRLLTISRATPPKNSPDVLIDPGPPVRLLQRCNMLSLLMAVFGFILAVIGIIAYAWVYTPVAVSAFSTALLGACILSAFIAVW